MARLSVEKVGGLAGTFVVPDYQRGYRWTHFEIEAFLEDVWAHIKAGSSRGDEDGTREYWLQPIVVKRMPPDRGTDRWELVDGQQRLTTCYMIRQHIDLHCPTEEALQFDFEFSTRPKIGDALRQKTCDELRGGKCTNLDSHLIHRAYETIDGWFAAEAEKRVAKDKKQEVEVEKRYVMGAVRKAIQDQLTVIWYQLPDDADAVEAFRRLNIGQIRLTDAELIKAQLLTAVAKADGESEATRTAAQWDLIERDLHDNELWAFLRAEDETPRIGALLRAIPDQGESDRPYALFNDNRRAITDNPTEFWDRVQTHHGALMGWYNDADCYHLIGFLIHTNKCSLKSLLKKAGACTKSEFTRWLADTVRQSLKLSEKDVRGLNYEEDKAALPTVLLLFNVVSAHPGLKLIFDSGSASRPDSLSQTNAGWFSFHNYRKTQWELEHIHAQNAEALTTQEEWNAWIKDHQEALEKYHQEELDERDVADLREQCKKFVAGETRAEDEFRRLSSELIRITSLDLGDGVNGHSISNLALLDRGVNSVLKNSIFEVKRQKLIQIHKSGSPILPATLRVFLKYYSREYDHLHFWTRSDREAYLEAIVDHVRPFLTADQEQ